MKVLIKAFLLALLCATPLFTATALAYDEALAKTYAQFFASFDEKQVPKALHMMPPEKVVEAIKQGEDIVLLDVRTHQEQGILAVKFGETLSIPMNEVFEPENLARIPTDRKVVVTCQSGLRCTIIELALRNVGFDNVYAMKGGLKALMAYLGPKTAF
ncbi:MAG: rhodanese-like domain-containing protein [Thiohalocapsa sp.]